jgi:tRNA threonylcarbamoyladenosine biosynthesis protein TsaB
MILLVVDTCYAKCSVAIFIDGKCASFLVEEIPHKQAELLVMMIEGSLKKLQLKYSDITHLCATVGPGSFTGIRIGIASIQGINAALNVPTIGVSTLEALSILKVENDIVSTLNASRGEVYCQRFCDGIPKSNIEVLSLETAKKFVDDSEVTGFLGNNELPDAQKAGMCALRKLHNHSIVNFPLEPLYIREPDALVSK